MAHYGKPMFGAASLGQCTTSKTVDLVWYVEDAKDVQRLLA